MGCSKAFSFSSKKISIYLRVESWGICSWTRLHFSISFTILSKCSSKSCFLSSEWNWMMVSIRVSERWCSRLYNLCVTYLFMTWLSRSRLYRSAKNFIYCWWMDFIKDFSSSIKRHSNFAIIFSLCWRKIFLCEFSSCTSLGGIRLMCCSRKAVFLCSSISSLCTVLITVSILRQSIKNYLSNWASVWYMMCSFLWMRMQTSQTGR